MNIMIEHLIARHGDKKIPLHLALTGGEIYALASDDRFGNQIARALAGVDREFSARVTIAEISQNITAPRLALRANIMVIHQQPLIFPTLTALENLHAFLPYHKRRGLIEIADRLWADLADDHSPKNFPAKIPTEKLSLADQRRVEIVRALLNEPRLLILNEALAAFGNAARHKIVASLRKYPEMAAVLITAAPSDILNADKFSVVTRKELTPTPFCAPTAAAVEKLTADFYAPKNIPELKIGKTNFEILGLRIHHNSPEISFSLRQGEICGVTGYAGSGVENLCSLFTGAAKARKGVLTINGKNLRASKLSKNALYRHGVAMLLPGANSIPQAEIFIVADFPLEQDFVAGKPFDYDQAFFAKTVFPLAAQGKTIIVASFNFDKLLRYANTLAIFHQGELCPPRAIKQWTLEEINVCAEHGKAGFASLL